MLLGMLSRYVCANMARAAVDGDEVHRHTRLADQLAQSGGPYLKIRNRISVGVAYGSDVDQVCEVLGEVGEQHTEVCAHPHPRVRMRAFGASSLDFDLLVWIEHPQDRGRIAHELLMQIYKRFDEVGIEIPFSKHDVYIKELPRREDAAE